MCTFSYPFVLVILTSPPMAAVPLLSTTSLHLRHPGLLFFSSSSPPFSAFRHFIKHLPCLSAHLGETPNGSEFGDPVDPTEMRRLPFTASAATEVKELDELPEKWRRGRLAWMCKTLPSHKKGMINRVLDANKKWVRQEDASYVVVHCIRIRENEAAFWVFKWMSQQQWFRFNFSLATKLADYMGKEGKHAKCRELFNDIINQGLVPFESTFHILIVAYLSASGEDCLQEACDMYQQMIQLGRYRPQLSLHNALFRALLSKPVTEAKSYLKLGEFIFHNLVTTGYPVYEDIFAGLIWLHSYQGNVDYDRISSLRNEMKLAGFEESKDVLLSITRACSKIGDVVELEKTWVKLLSCDGVIPSQAFVYKMEVYAKSGEPMKALDVFEDMKTKLDDATIAAYHKVIKVMCDAHEMEIAESLMEELNNTSLKPLTPLYISLMNMYFRLGLHDKVESAFCSCIEKCYPNRIVYGIYLDSLVQIGSMDKAEAVFSKMVAEDVIGVTPRSCNSILKGYLSSEVHEKALKIYNYMRKKNYDIEPPLMEKLDVIIDSRRRRRFEPTRPSSSTQLSPVHREILIGLLLGGLPIEPDEYSKKHFICFEFNNKSVMHSALKQHLYEKFREWLHPSSQPTDRLGKIPGTFSTFSHTSFSFYAHQFWPEGRWTVPKLVHRWLSPRALAYWYMYSGHRTSSGDILLKIKGDHEGVERIVNVLKAMSLEFRVKQKEKVSWLGFLGGNSTRIWDLIQPYIFSELKELLYADDSSKSNHYHDESLNESTDSD
ncbi:hypothetical protein Droror1_Dr00019285 [Drosera rotundifolia]